MNKDILTLNKGVLYKLLEHKLMTARNQMNIYYYGLWSADLNRLLIS